MTSWSKVLALTPNSGSYLLSANNQNKKHGALHLQRIWSWRNMTPVPSHNISTRRSILGSLWRSDLGSIGQWRKILVSSGSSSTVPRTTPGPWLYKRSDDADYTKLTTKQKPAWCNPHIVTGNDNKISISWAFELLVQPKRRADCYDGLQYLRVTALIWMWKHLWLNCHELQKNKIAANFESKYFSPQQPRFGSNTKQARTCPGKWTPRAARRQISSKS